MPPRDLPLSQGDARRILAELAKRGVSAADPFAFKEIQHKFLLDLHLKQVRAHTDPRKRKAFRTSRRAGKTTLLARIGAKHALNRSGVFVPYVTLTRKSAKLIMWPELIRLNQQYRLGGHPNHTDLTMKFPNESVFFLTGANTAADIEKLRGQKYPCVLLDEAQAFGDHIRSLYDDVLDPATIDFDGEVVMAGTPGAACAGFFFEATTGILPEWSHHHWTIYDNPFLPHASAWLERKKLEKGWTDDHPTFRREYLGEWVLDPDALVYKYQAGRNSYTGEPLFVVNTAPNAMTSWRFGLGVDLGFEDPTSFTIVAWNPYIPELLVPVSFKRGKMNVGMVAAKIAEFRAEYRLQFIVIDEGGLGKMIAEELRDRYGIPCEQAEKKEKYDAIQVVNSDMYSARVKFHEHGASDLISELKILQWDDDKPGKEDDRFPNDCADSFIYAFRKAQHFRHRPAEKLPDIGSPEYFEKIKREHFEERRREMQRAGLNTDPLRMR